MEEKAGGNWEDIAQKSLSAEASSYSRSEKLRDKDGISPREKKMDKENITQRGRGDWNQPATIQEETLAFWYHPEIKEKGKTGKE